jgi:phosphoribosylanthranilate isomerase
LSKLKFKICGVKSLEILDCCIVNNVDFFGLIFFKKSPRNIEIEDAQKLIFYSKNKSISSVGVFVNEPIIQLQNLLKKLKLDYIQLHGNEDKNYMSEIKKNNSIKIIKNISMNSKEDLLKIEKYPNADFLLFDYKPSEKELPGGNAKKFSWDLLKYIKTDQPWFLSGGINIKNINEVKNYAIPYGIDISSGVESSPGNKSINKINSLFQFYDSK